MKQTADLHIHSNISIDGEIQPEELVRRCAARGISTIALTDHNSIRGIASAKQAAMLYGVTVLSGIELDSIMDGTHLHILGYGIDETDPIFADIESGILQQERYAGGLRMELVRKCCRLQLDGAWLCKNVNHGVITGELIAEAALNNPENQHNALIQPYLPGGPRSDNPYLNFYWDYCAPGKPAYVPIRYMHTQQAIEQIHACGGVAVLAHPGAGAGIAQNTIARLVQYGLDGIEVYSSYHTAQQTEMYEAIAKQYGLLSTCGSDFHDRTKPSVALGETMCNHTSTLAVALQKGIRNCSAKYARRLQPA